MRRALWHSPPPPAHHLLHRWLCHRGSLTQQVQALHPDFSVTLLCNRHARLSHDEAQGLGLRRGEWGCVREVLLLSNRRPVIFARSVVARQHLHGAWHLLNGLGNRPLGAALFADPRVRRGRIQFQRIDSRHPAYRHLCAETGDRTPCWGRRSRFWRQGAPLLVAEYFLPSYFEYTHPT